MAAGYSAKSVMSQGCQLLKKPKVKEEIERRRLQLQAKNEDEVSKIRAKLRSIAYSPDSTKRDALRALELLGKAEAMFVERHVVTPDIPQLTADEIKRLRGHARALEGVGAAVRDDLPVIDAQQPTIIDHPSETK